MSNYRRMKLPGATYFFTVVTRRRKPILASPMAVQTLRECVASVRQEMPFSIDAWVVLPDHMHAVWTMPDDDADYSHRWARIKALFTRRCPVAHESAPGHDAGIWQPRFWEHTIRDERDATAHMDYLHYNPVKHNLVARVSEWPYSSFHRLVRAGKYPADWGRCEPAAPPVPVRE